MDLPQHTNDSMCKDARRKPALSMGDVRVSQPIAMVEWACNTTAGARHHLSFLIQDVIKWISFCKNPAYEALQVCASISVSKRYNFHPPYLVTFVNTLFFCFLPKYLGIPVLTKYFVNICLLVSWGKPQFLLFYLNFRPIVHPKYIKIHIKAFCRYQKYLSFATVDTPVTVLGAEQFVFP